MSGMRYVVCLLLLSIIARGPGAVQWPTDSQRLIATFGQNINGSFSRGLHIAVTDEEIRPIDDGEIVFYHDPRSTPLPSPLGTFVIMQHEQTTTLRSLYAHIRSAGEGAFEGRTVVRKDEVLGIGGGSGMNHGNSVFIAIADIEIPQMVNPLLLLPPIRDTQRPTIRNPELRRANRTVAFSRPGGVEEGEWELMAEIFDPSEHVRFFAPMAPYKVRVTVNGMETLHTTFDALQEKDGVVSLHPSSGARFEDLYHEGFVLRLGTVRLTKGITNIEIAARDYQGNERVVAQQFRVP